MVVVAVIAVGLAAHGPARLSHAWHQFKQPQTAALRQNALSRYGALSGNGRYTYWSTAVSAMPGHLLGGYGPGTFQLVWLRDAPFFSYITNAHSLYIETLTEVGVVGLALLVGFLGLVLGAAVRLAVRRAPGWPALADAPPDGGALTSVGADLRVPGAAITAALARLCPVGGGRLGLAGSGSARGRDAARRRRARAQRARPAADGCASGRRAWRSWRVRLACLVAIGIPLAATSALRSSQAAASAGELSTAAADAASAVRLEPDGAAARLQLALVDEAQGDLSAAIVQASRSGAEEPANWEPWFVLSRLQAESGHPAAALAAYRHARSLDPHSPLFRS